MRDLFLYVADSDRFHAISVRPEDRDLVSFRACKALGKKWRQVSVVPDYRKRVRWGDFPSLVCGAPVMTLRAWEALKDLIGSQVEALPLQHPQEPLVVTNVLRRIDCLDRKASRLCGSEDGEARLGDHPLRLQGRAAQGRPAP
jgi:hypothetical protein